MGLTGVLDEEQAWDGLGGVDLYLRLGMMRSVHLYDVSDASVG